MCSDDKPMSAPAATGEDDMESAREVVREILQLQPHELKWSSSGPVEIRVDGAAPYVAEAIAAARAQGVQEERERWLDCASVDATMEGPKLKGWNRSALDRLWRSPLSPEGVREGAEKMRALDEAVIEAAYRLRDDATMPLSREQDLWSALAARDAALRGDE